MGCGSRRLRRGRDRVLASPQASRTTAGYPSLPIDRAQRSTSARAFASSTVSSLRRPLSEHRRCDVPPCALLFCQSCKTAVFDNGRVLGLTASEAPRRGHLGAALEAFCDFARARLRRDRLVFLRPFVRRFRPSETATRTASRPKCARQRSGPPSRTRVALFSRRRRLGRWQSPQPHVRRPARRRPCD
jgi:hypothetical protein